MYLGPIAPAQPVYLKFNPWTMMVIIIRINNDKVCGKHTRDINKFLAELDDANDNNEVMSHDDDLQELDDAFIIDVEYEHNDQKWDRNAAIALIVREVTSYKAANGIKVRDSTTSHFNCPLIWWKSPHHDYPYLMKYGNKVACYCCY